MMMPILLVCLLVAVVLVTVMQARSPKPGLRQAQIALLIVTVVVVAGQALRSSRTTDSTANLAAFERTATYRMGQLVGASAQNEGTILVLRWDVTDTSLSGVALADAQDQGLREGLGDSLLKIAVEGPKQPHDDEAVEAMLFAASPVTPDQIRQWVESHENVVAIVALMDLPPLLDPDFLAGLPPVYLRVMSISSQLEELVEQGHVKGAVADKLGLGRIEAPPADLDPDQVFDLGFDLLTAPETP